MAEKKQLSPEEYSPERKEAEKEKEQKEMEGNDMANKKQTQTKKKEVKEEKKPLNKEEEIEKWNEKNEDYNITISDSTIELPTDIKFVEITKVINNVRRLRTILKKLGYKTSSKPGKYT